MRKTAIITLFLSLHILLYGQDQVYINQPFTGLPWRQTNTREIDSLNQLPARISYAVDQLIKTSMTDFVDQIAFMKGQTIDIENWIAKDSSLLISYDFIIPKYELFFELRDTTINIQRYSFRLALDQYGQIIDFDWPRKDFNKRADFITGNMLKKEAIKYCLKKNYKTKTCIHNLKYDKQSQRLHWEISFLQKSMGNEYNYSKEYKTIVLDALSKEFIAESEMHSVGVSD